MCPGEQHKILYYHKIIGASRICGVMTLTTHIEKEVGIEKGVPPYNS